MINYHCDLCPYWLSRIHSCPSSVFFQDSSNFELAVEYFMVAMSILPYFALCIICLYSLYIRTLRGCVISSFFLLQYIMIEILKRIFKESRPEGACHKGYGFPSQHACFAVLNSFWYLILSIF